ncbi:MAG TPA: hypothetical protein VG267_05575 [Terracidiphilus sp.]|nr:hypothetical protein [Terracidiphilus sp.]
MKMTATRRMGQRPALKNPAIASVIEDGPIGPFVNANPRLIPGQRFEMGLNIVVDQPVTVQLTSSDPSVASVPDEIGGWPDYSTAMFEIVGHSLGTVTITATLGDDTATTTASVKEDTTEIASLVGSSAGGYAARWVYEFGSTGGEITINMSGVVVGGERIATVISETPEVASVPESVTIPDNSNWPTSFPLELHAVGTTRITVESRGVTLETYIEVIAPILWIADINLEKGRLRAGDERELTITMTDDTVRDSAITLHRHEKLEMPTALIVPRGKRTGSVRLRVLEDLGGDEQPLQIRWLNSLYLVGISR